MTDDKFLERQKRRDRDREICQSLMQSVPEESRKIKIEDTSLSKEAKNILKLANVKVVEHLVVCQKNKFLLFAYGRGLNSSIIKEIEEFEKTHGAFMMTHEQFEAFEKQIKS